MVISKRIAWFFAVHLALTVVSLVLGTAIGILGIQAARRTTARVG